jgi:hypothetical protein
MNDIAEYSTPNILFFKGVFPEKYDIDTIFTNQIMDSLRISTEGDMKEVDDLQVFDKIPSKFTTMDDWPKSTNLKCWWCHRNFKSIPVFVPINISNKGATPATEITVHGNMCHFSCASAYIDMYFSERSIKWERHEMLKILYKKMTGQLIEYIPRTPLPFRMMQYGGNDTANTFSKKIVALTDCTQSSIHDLTPLANDISNGFDQCREHI